MQHNLQMHCWDQICACHSSSCNATDVGDTGHLQKNRGVAEQQRWEALFRHCRRTIEIASYSIISCYLCLGVLLRQPWLICICHSTAAIKVRQNNHAVPFLTQAIASSGITVYTGVHCIATTSGDIENQRFYSQNGPCASS